MVQEKIPSSQQAAELRKNLIQSFDEEELRLLCSDIGVDFENLGGDGKEAIANRLIAYLNRRRSIATLIEKLNKERPNVNWEKLVAEPSKYSTFAMRVVGDAINLTYRRVGGITHGNWNARRCRHVAHRSISSNC